MSTTFQIITHGRVYIYSRRELHFEVTLEKVQSLLRGKSRSSAFTALYEGLADRHLWLLRDDTVKPYGDKRQNLTRVCSIDLDQDKLFYSDDKSGHIQIPLARIYNAGSDPIPQSEFIPFELASPPHVDLTAITPPYHQPVTSVPERHLVLSSRVLLDFADQWRHILRSCYNDSTFRRLAKAVISIAINDFQVEEVSHKEHINFRSSYITVLSVPNWEPFEQHELDIGGTTVILHQDLQAALEIVKEKANGTSEATNPTDNLKTRTYLLLSVRHMMVCDVNSGGFLSYTAPTKFMDGISLPSSSAIELLLQVLSLSTPPLCTPIHQLPLEIQDQILRHVSKGSFEAARLGCVLGLGSPFTWMRADDWPRRGGEVELFISPSHRNEYSPVESKICFGGVFSGLSYR